MRIKNILSLIAFSAAFILSVSLVGLPQNNFYSPFNQARSYRQNRENIRALLRRDVSSGSFREQTAYSLIEDSRNSESPFDIAAFAETTEEYVNNSQSIDDSNLPADFRAAWQAHMNAWREQSDFLNRVKADYPKSAVKGEMIDDPLGLYEDEAQTFSIQTNEINLTWFKVLQTAQKYGVDTSGY